MDWRGFDFSRKNYAYCGWNRNGEGRENELVLFNRGLLYFTGWTYLVEFK